MTPPLHGPPLAHFALVLLLILHPASCYADGDSNYGRTEVDPSPSVFSLGRSSDDLTDSSARQPELGSRTRIDDMTIGTFTFSEVQSSNLASSAQYSDEDDDLKFLNDNDIRQRRSVDEEDLDDKFNNKINADSVSLVDNELDAPATLVNNQLDSVNVASDLANVDFYEKIQPTKLADSIDEQKSFTKTIDESGEGQRASARGRSLPLPKPRSASEMAAQTTNSSGLDSSIRSDKPSPDIHDFINGFVKLLNGNVPVQANPNAHSMGGRPLYPIRTRINNRGPPRITDLPPLELDPPPMPPRQQLPAQHPANNIRIPPPYPFDIPPPISSLPPQPTVFRPFLSGIPLPEQIVPQDPNKISITTESNIPMENFNKSYIAPSKTKFNPFGGEYHKTKPVGMYNDTEVKDSTKKPGPYKPVNSFIQPSEITPLTKPTFTVVQKKDPVVNESSNRPNLTVTETNKDLTVSTSKPSESSATNMFDSEIININVTSSVSSIDNTFNSTTNTTVKEETITSGNFNYVENVPTTTETTTTTTSKTTTSTTTTTTTTTTKEPSTNKPSSTKKPTTPIIESSMAEVSTPGTQKPVHWEDSTSKTRTTPLQSETNNKYFPRPGIVLDDPEYKPGGGSLAYRPIVTVPPKKTNNGDIFDVTVSAIQGPGTANTGQPYIYPDIEGVQVGGAAGGGAGEVSVITTAEAGQHFVSIDGKRTYINLFNTSPAVEPTATTKQPVIKPTGTYTTGQVGSEFPPVGGSKRPSHPHHRRPAQPPVRIDTCIVGDDSTCDKAQNERCRTELGVSSCHCRPGYSRRKHREPCIRVVSIVMSLRVDRRYDQKLTWSDRLHDKDSREYLELEYESSSAIDSAMQMTPFSDEFLNCHVNSLYTTAGGGRGSAGPVFVNLTLQLVESAETLRPAIKKDIQRHLLGVIHRRSNNIGSSSLWVDSPTGSVSQLQDLDECQHPDLHDCHLVAACTNTFGSFQCACPPGYRDPWAGSAQHGGRECHTCPPDHCNHRGECRYQNDQPTCKCAGTYYGAQCEIDGEVLGVAIGASVAAVIIITSTLVCLCMWSRRWNREQKVAAGMGSPVFGYMAAAHNGTVKSPALGSSPYQVSLEDRLRWAQIADVMAQATNHYAPEPGGGVAARGFGYGGTLPHLNAPVPMPRLSLRPASVHGTRAAADSSCSEEEDRTDLLGRNFHVPRPKSRSSVANQSGIYYDVDYEQQAVPTCIPMNTYTMSNRSNYYRT